MRSKLYLASGSYARRQLLTQMHLSFELLKQDADESKCDWGLALPQVVQNIAAYKMNHVLMPEASLERETCFVLTADTLCLDKEGNLQGKPYDREDAITKIKKSRGGITAGTAFCLDRKVYRHGAWSTQERIERYVEAYFEFEVPDHLIAEYITASRCLETAGAIVIEGYGFQFLKRIEGSFTTILGLPVFELRQALEHISFFDSAN